MKPGNQARPKSVLLLRRFALLVVFGVASVFARVDETFPPADDVRAPDRTLTRVEGVVPTQILFSPNGRELLSAGGDVLVRAWDARTGEQGTGELVRTFAGLKSPAIALAFSVDGKRLLARSGDAVQAWDYATGSVTDLLAGDRVADTPSQAKRGEFVAIADGTAAKVWHEPTRTLLCTQAGHAAVVVAVAINPSHGQKMATLDAAGGIKYWTMPLPRLSAGDLEKIAAAVPAKASVAPKRPRRVLVFWRADAILHARGVPAVNHAIELMGRRTGAFEADFSRDFEALEPAVLARYDAIVMNSTAHVVMPEANRRALLAFARSGKGVVGIHAAIDMFKPWPDAAELIGATFGGHPWGPGGTWAVKLEARDHPLLRAFGGKDFRVRDEFYVMAEPYRRSDRRVLLSADISDPATAKPGSEPLHRTDGDFALAWVKRFGEGRVFYGVFGHVAEVMMEPAVQQFYLDGIQYALGDLACEDGAR